MISYLRKSVIQFKLSRHLKAIANYIEIGDSYFYNSFRLNNYTGVDSSLKALVVGDNSILDCTISLESKSSQVIIGNNNWIGGSKIFCRNRLEIGDNVMISYGCYICDHDSHSISYLDRQDDILQQL